MKFEQMLTWAIPLGIGGAIVWWAMSQQQPAAGVSAPAVGATTNGQVFLGSATGYPAQATITSTSNILAMASQQLGIPASELVQRGLRPEDLGLTTSWNFTSTLANTWENWITATVADNTFIAIQGVSYGGTNFAQARIQAGARYSGFWNLSFISGLQNQLYYEPSPIIAQQNQPVVIDVISKAAATESINLIGTVVERRGMVISP